MKVKWKDACQAIAIGFGRGPQRNRGSGVLRAPVGGGHAALWRLGVSCLCFLNWVQIQELRCCPHWSVEACVLSVCIHACGVFIYL